MIRIAAYPFKRRHLPRVYVAAYQMRLRLEVPTHQGFIRASGHSAEGLVLPLVLKHQMIIVKLRYLVFVGLSVVFGGSSCCEEVSALVLLHESFERLIMQEPGRVFREDLV